MIIEALLSLVYKLLSLFISPFNVPQAPEEFINSIPEYFELLESAHSLWSLFFPIKFAPFFAITAVIMVVEHGYPFIMWILRKIPFIGIE